MMEEAVSELVDKGRLSDRHHAQRLYTADEIGPQDAAVFETMAVIAPGQPLQRSLEAVETHLDTAISDGMDCHLPAARMSPPDQVVELFLGHHGQTQVVGGGVLEEGFRDRCGTPDQRAVGQQLERADTQ